MPCLDPSVSLYNTRSSDRADLKGLLFKSNMNTLLKHPTQLGPNDRG
uniref:Uncharacterized protein n=1 Tax=Rhizophora mucronata TaxID=61149 RepID=A0A2P2NT73_RHIMU